MIGKHIRQYEIREELGRGGMGVVYKAHDATLNRTVALKLVPEAKGATSEQRLRLLNEARAAAGLNHPNICTVYEVGEDAGVQLHRDRIRRRSHAARVHREAPPR